MTHRLRVNEDCFFIFTFTSFNLFNPNIFHGNWEAIWSLSNKNLNSLPSTKSNTMLGYVSFDKNGNVYLEGFGNSDCIFSSDTISYNTSWDIQGNILIIGNSQFNQFEYKINSIKKDEIRLTLLDDISLVLRK